MMNRLGLTRLVSRSLSLSIRDCLLCKFRQFCELRCNLVMEMTNKLFHLTTTCDFSQQILTHTKLCLTTSWAGCMLGKQLPLTLRYSQLSVRPAHKIPHAMRDRVQSELNRMVSLGVIAPVADPLDFHLQEM